MYTIHLAYSKVYRRALSRNNLSNENYFFLSNKPTEKPVGNSLSPFYVRSGLRVMVQIATRDSA